MHGITSLLDVTDAAHQLGVEVRFIRRLVAEGRLRHYKIGKYLRFDAADLQAFIEAGRREARS